MKTYLLNFFFTAVQFVRCKEAFTVLATDFGFEDQELGYTARKFIKKMAAGRNADSCRVEFSVTEEELCELEDMLIFLRCDFFKENFLGSYIKELQEQINWSLADSSPRQIKLTDYENSERDEPDSYIYGEIHL